MAQELLTERYAEQIAGVISCWDRVVIRGTLTTVGYPEGMSAYLLARRTPSPSKRSRWRSSCAKRSCCPSWT